MFVVFILALQSASTASVPTAPVAAPAPSPVALQKLPAHRPVQPRSDPGRWFTDVDYPSRAARNEERGTVLYALVVGIDGRASACSIRVSSGSAVLDAETCKIAMRRARFNPATDADGNAIAGEFRGYVEWGTYRGPLAIPELKVLKRPPQSPAK
jgi:periplasmic protein TonB